jgi:hypothetical protein
MTLQNVVVNKNNNISHAYIILQEDPATPNNPGHIVVIHGIKMYPMHVGAGAGE